jgi:hypothetical protein
MTSSTTLVFVFSSAQTWSSKVICIVWAKEKPFHTELVDFVIMWYNLCPLTIVVNSVHKSLETMLDGSLVTTDWCILMMQMEKETASNDGE